MGTRKAFLLGGSSHRKALEPLLAAQSFTMERPEAKRVGNILKLFARDHRHLLLVDLDMPRTSGADLVERLKKAAQTPVPLVFLSNTAHFEQHEKALESLLAKPDVDWVRTPIDHVEFRLRVSRVTTHAPIRAKALVKVTALPAIQGWTLPELRSDSTGRLDATRVAQHFGWSLSDLSRGLHRSVQAVHKTPDAPSLQPKLEELERAALLARRLVTANPAELRKWLNTPSPDLDRERPGTMLLTKPAIVVQWLEDAALGHPA